MFDFVKAILVGICASAPLGPVCAFVFQKTLNNGRKAGIVTGLGSALADTLFAAIAVFAVAAVQKFIEDYNTWILIIGGGLVVLIGISMALKREPTKVRRTTKVSAKFSAQAFLMAFSNPGALALMFALMLLFKVDGSCDKLITVAGVAAGTALWWTFFAVMVDKLGQNLNIKTIITLNRVFGVLVTAFGAWMTIRGIMSL